MSFKVIIPARYASTRLPGKALLEIAGKPMLQHVYETSVRSGASTVLVATDDERIREAAEGFGALVHMTSSAHRSGTERIAQVVEERGEPPDAIIVNVQGDEPLLPAGSVRQAAALLERDADAEVATLCEPIEAAAELFDPGVVKVVCNRKGEALYFSRAPIPWDRDEFAKRPGHLPMHGAYFRHIGIYAYRAGYLRELVAQEPSGPERVEGLEQLRCLHHGARIRVVRAEQRAGPGVDTERDLERVRALMS